jgi:hypothetical protein
MTNMMKMKSIIHVRTGQDNRSHSYLHSTLVLVLPPVLLRNTNDTIWLWRPPKQKMKFVLV